MTDKYIGNELELFKNAKNWKSYYRGYIKPYLNGKVLEVGAGLGGTTEHLCDGSQKDWLCLEPDPELSATIQKMIDTKVLPSCCRLTKGTIQDVSKDEKFNAIIYIDVIEHIEDDRAELQRAYDYLEDGGVLMILVPAHQFLYSAFDKAIGHYRRYNKSMLRNTVPLALKQLNLMYLDSVGLLASIANKLFLKRSYPNLQQILFWDNVMVSISRVTDPIIFKTLGKSVLGIWKK
jgi:SAM-dependent methyltransferase